MAWKMSQSLTATTNNTRSTSSTSAKSIPHNNSTWKPDLFAKKFVPAWLQNINNLPARNSYISPTPPDVNFEEYAQTFLPKPLFLACPSTTFIREIQSPRYALDIQPLGPQIPFQDLDIRNYYLHFCNVLIDERRALAEDLKQYNLYEVALYPETLHARIVFRLRIPGLQEYVPPVIPSIFIGDAVIIRLVYAGAMAGFFDGNEYVAYIHAINRREVRTRFILSIEIMRNTLF